jgi:DNA transformation protein and related proteins
MNNLQKVTNIGKVMSKKLEQVGIKNETELKAVGSEKAFLLVKSIDSSACICSLYALEGAIQGIRWHSLSKEKKEELLNFFNMCK